jgi:capsule polysaccharide export protein KpsE/RkpR
MSILRWCALTASVAFALPALAQMPPPGPDMTCWCLKQAVDDTNTDLATKQSALSASQANLAQLDGQLAQLRANLDVNNPQAVAQFRQLLAQRDAAFRESNGDIVTAVQAATARYNQAVASYNNQCAGRPLPPPPPGPLVCR